jgi:membrane associated rhomboid family serine protease
MHSIPPVTRALIIANAVIYLAEMLTGNLLLNWFALWPFGSDFMPWQVITYSFLHAQDNFFHLFFNMLALYMFGSDIERIFGQKRYLIYYLSAVLTAALAQLAVSVLSGGPAYPTVGASGGVFGILLAFALYFPRRIIVLIIPPIPMPAWLFVILYGLIELYLGVTGTQQGVAHFAHLGGMLGGFLTIQYWRGRWPFRRPGW